WHPAKCEFGVERRLVNRDVSRLRVVGTEVADEVRLRRHTRGPQACDGDRDRQEQSRDAQACRLPQRDKRTVAPTVTCCVRAVIVPEPAYTEIVGLTNVILYSTSAERMPPR